MKVYSPVPAEEVRVVADRRQVGLQTIGVVDDNLDPPLMDELVKVLREALPDSQVKVWVKPIGTAPAPDSLIEEMAKEVQVALSGVGM